MRCGFIDFARYHGRNVKDVGSTQLRVDGIVAKDQDFGHWTQGSKWDAYIFQKVYWYEMLEAIGEPKILDLCDPDFLKTEQEGGVDLVKMSKYVDAITCSSPALAERISKFIKNIPVVYIPDRINFDLFPEPKTHSGEAKTVVWFGYWHNATKVLNDYNILSSIDDLGYKLRIVSNQEFYPTAYRELEVENVQYDADNAYYEIQKGDVFINPFLGTDANFKYKSNNKSVIAWKLGLPLASDPSELLKYKDPKEREAEKRDKLKLVEDKYNILESAKQYKEIIKQINANHRRNKAKK